MVELEMDAGVGGMFDIVAEKHPGVCSTSFVLSCLRHMLSDAPTPTSPARRDLAPSMKRRMTGNPHATPRQSDMQTRKPQINHGTTAFLPPTFSFPNTLTYHLHPCTALGTIVATSLHRNTRAGAHPDPATIQNPAHSTHSHR